MIDFDKVILAIPPGVHSFISDGLKGKSPEWDAHMRD